MNLVGQTIGQIRVIDILAQGGMGDVYLGFDQRLQRQVALKSIRPDRLDPKSRARFLREARILSQLEDPKICQIYDYIEGDESDFLVLELVRGRTLKEVGGEGHLQFHEKLRIANQIARVLVEAHDKGVIHRDLKPANVMVTDEGEIKVLDFGLANSVRDGLTISTDPEDAPSAATRGLERDETSTANTQAGEIVGTVAYMSPEQARGEAATPASDLYSLGVVLHELFTGTPAYEPGLSIPSLIGHVSAAKTRAPHEIDKAVAQLITELESLTPSVRPTAREVVQRLTWIRDRPKRRMRWGLAIGLLMLALGAGLKYTVDLKAALQRAVVAQDNAERARTEAEQISDFLVDLFEVSDLDRSLGETITARELLDRASAQIRSEFEQQPQVRARFMSTIGEVYQGLGLYDRSRSLLETAYRIRLQEAEDSPLDLAQSAFDLGWILRLQGDYSSAEEYFATSLSIRERELDGQHLEVGESLNALGILRRRQGRYVEAEELYLRSLQIKELHFGPGHIEVSKSINNLALLYTYQGRYDEAEPLIRRSIAIKEETLPNDHPSIARGLNNLANLLADTGRFDEAEQLYRRNLAMWERVGGPDHPETSTSLNNLGLIFFDQSRFPEAEPFFLRTLNLRRETVGTKHPDYASAQAYIGMLYSAVGRFQEAEQVLVEALETRREVLGPEHPEVASNQAHLAHLFLRTGRFELALETATASSDSLREVRGADQPDTAFADAIKGAAAVRLGRSDGIATSLESAIDVLDDSHAQAQMGLALAFESLAALRFRSGNRTEAKDLLGRARALHDRLFDPSHPDREFAADLHRQLSSLPRESL